MKLKPGTRVAVKFAPSAPLRTGTVVKYVGRNAGYKVALDEPKANQFEPDEVRVYGYAMTPLDEKLRERYEAQWATAPFVNRDWVNEVSSLG